MDSGLDVLDRHHVCLIELLQELFDQRLGSPGIAHCHGERVRGHHTFGIEQQLAKGSMGLCIREPECRFNAALDLHQLFDDRAPGRSRGGQPASHLFRGRQCLVPVPDFDRHLLGRFQVMVKRFRLADDGKIRRDCLLYELLQMRGLPAAFQEAKAFIENEFLRVPGQGGFKI